MADQVRVFVSHHHSPEEDAFTARLVADLEAASADVWVDTAGIPSGSFVAKARDLIVRAYSQRRMEQWFADLVAATL